MGNDNNFNKMLYKGSDNVGMPPWSRLCKLRSKKVV